MSPHISHQSIHVYYISYIILYHIICDITVHRFTYISHVIYINDIFACHIIHVIIHNIMYHVIYRVMYRIPLHITNTDTDTNIGAQ